MTPPNAPSSSSLLPQRPPPQRLHRISYSPEDPPAKLSERRHLASRGIKLIGAFHHSITGVVLSLGAVIPTVNPSAPLPRSPSRPKTPNPSSSSPSRSSGRTSPGPDRRHRPRSFISDRCISTSFLRPDLKLPSPCDPFSGLLSPEPSPPALPSPEPSFPASQSPDRRSFSGPLVSEAPQPDLSHPTPSQQPDSLRWFPVTGSPSLRSPYRPTTRSRPSIVGSCPSGTPVTRSPTASPPKHRLHHLRFSRRRAPSPAVFPPDLPPPVAIARRPFLSRPSSDLPSPACCELHNDAAEGLLSPVLLQPIFPRACCLSAGSSGAGSPSPTSHRCPSHPFHGRPPQQTHRPSPDRSPCRATTKPPYCPAP